MRPALAGVLVLAFVWSGALSYVLPPFTAHMVMHTGVVAVAAPLLALSVPTAVAARLRAVPLSMVEGLAVWAWHAPVLHHLARAHPLGTVLEQGTFLLTGGLLWTAAIGGGAALRRRRLAAGTTALLLTAMHMTLLGALLALSTRPLYGHHGASDWLTPLQDQHLGGAVMVLMGGALYLLGALGLVADQLEPAVGTEVTE